MVVDGCHEAVKTEEEHEKIIELLQTRQKIPYRARQSIYALSGLIKCGKCGHTHTFLVKQNGSELMKPCWYKDPYGNKCTNKGVKAAVIEELILEEIRAYKECFLIDDNETDKKQIELLTAQIDEQDQLTAKYHKALERVNESYELGDYTRAEWLERRKKWGEEIRQAQNEISNLKRRLKSLSLVTSTDWLGTRRKRRADRNRV